MAGGQTTKIIDKGTIEKVGPYGLETLLIRLSKRLSILSRGTITNYALFILVGLISIILCHLLSFEIHGDLFLITVILLFRFSLQKNI